jgi:hypothetical protein
MGNSSKETSSEISPKKSLNPVELAKLLVRATCKEKTTLVNSLNVNQIH